MQRYFVPAHTWSEKTIKITGDDVHHMKRVMRFQAGDEIICNHPDGQAAICQITFLDNQVVYADIVNWLTHHAELPVDIAIAQALPKGDKLEWILQKGTELGAHRFLPFQAARSIVKWEERRKEKKVKRWHKIVKEASEQSHRNKIPSVDPCQDLSEIIEAAKDYDFALFAYEEEAKSEQHQSLGSALARLEKEQSLLVCIGPEGGFSDEEVKLLKANEFQAIRLGPRILRTETAALYTLASISYHFEEMRCSSCQQ
ncbi:MULTISPECIES: 16S rRNA (uracil(1498)-N(3))-methyltransferase [Clostridia]|uniref:16S rRNA (uracil(1498)-N(3))-methyltransferase n=1 Tax=Clostridia TaxID=186801 RepID=UPI000EA21497|nr:MULTISPECIES: 16S rRNA (uracil(1498)-N(3))-methyltransferase [Clostridia]NBJ68567.1 16S rRNA (uracil(1498)-N(3))-methyltransferase [Roseburia sp. 1XD42-34]RKI80747.1 16S rRNA (uracil(1498)-N(3))-methyltransferase [Clostridium sp. 1xD42-85]